MRRPLFILSGILTACINNDPDRFVISHVNVIAMDDDQLRRDYSVVIQDGRIRELGPAASVSVPRGFGEVPGEGRYLLPSLVDTHAHVCDAGDLTTYLAYGVGAIRNMRGTPFHLHLRSAVAASLLTGPRFFTAGPYISAPRISDPHAARRDAAEQRALGYDVIKLHGRMDLETLAALSAAAGELPIVGHVPRDQDLADVLKAGVMREISHAEEYIYTLRDRRGGQPRDAVIREAVRLTRAANVTVVPTLSTFRAIGEQVRDLEETLSSLPLEHLSPFSVRSIRPDQNRYARRFEPADTAWFQDQLLFQQQLVEALHRAQVTLLLGTDGNNPGSIPGFSVHEELELLVAAGLAPIEALHVGTRAGWVALTGEATAGRIQAGAPAELLLLAGNPLDDIRHARRPAGIVRDGRWIPGDTLRLWLAQLTARRGAEQPFVDRLWDNTMEDALSWLEDRTAAGDAPEIRTDTWRCQAELAVRDGVPEVALDALDRALAANGADALTLAYRGEVLSLLGRHEEAVAAWRAALATGPQLQFVRQRLEADH